MTRKGPHISISPDYVVNRILKINIDEFAEWPEAVRPHLDGFVIFAQEEIALHAAFQGL